MANHQVDNMRGGGQELVLADLARRYIDADRFVFVELGVWSGLTAQYMLREFPMMYYYGIDPYQGFYNASQKLCDTAKILAMTRLDHFPNANIRIKSSEEAVGDFADNSVDLLFIDADHHYEACLQDIRLWWPKVNRVVAGHDFTGAGVRAAVEDFCRETNNSYATGDAKMWWIIK